MSAVIKEVKVFTRERWLPVLGYEERYSVSSKGRVKSTLRGKLLRPMVSKKGYRYTTLYSGLPGRNAGYKLKVSCLVLLTFVGPALDREACHRNDCKSDDNLHNLYWGTRKQNVADCIRNGNSAKGERNGQSKLLDSDRDFIRRSKLKGTELAQMFNVSPAIVSMTRNFQRGK
ncbi:MAG: NUMOD4 domain-containing protein [Citrobacter sp.]